MRSSHQHGTSKLYENPDRSKDSPPHDCQTTISTKQRQSHAKRDLNCECAPVVSEGTSPIWLADAKPTYGMELVRHHGICIAIHKPGPQRLEWYQTMTDCPYMQLAPPTAATKCAS